jgi:peptide/nickel transport system substrate-binding protein
MRAISHGLRTALAPMVAAAAFLAASQGCSTSTGPSNGIITVAVPSSPNNLDPRIGTDEVSQKIQQLVFTTLLALDDELRVVGGLATGWVTPNPTTYVVSLRRGVRFHDGHELTADDVVYTFESFLDPEFISPRKGAYRMLAGVRAVDPYTVEFTLKEPFGSFPINLVMPIVPKGAGADLRRHPVGTGPYRFVELAPDDHVTLAPFPSHFLGGPRNAGVTIKVVPDDMMRGLELRKGSVDIVVNDLAPDIVHQLESDPDLTVTRAPGTDYAYLGFNLRDPLLEDRRVRHAIGYALDRDAIAKYLRRGLATPAIGILPPVSWAFAPDVFRFALDTERAKRLLDEAGHPDPDGDGPLPRLRMSLKVSNNEFNRLQSAVIQQNLREVGIEVDVRSYEFATLYADVLKGAFQMFTLQWVGVSDPDMLRRVFHSRQMPPAGFNRGFFSNPEADRAIDAATASTDEAERRRLYVEAQRIVAEEAPYISLWYKTNVAVARASLRDVRLTPTAEFTFLRDVVKDSEPARGRAN